MWVASRGLALVSLPSTSRIDKTTTSVVETMTMADIAPVAMVGGYESLWAISHNPDELVRIGPVPVPKTATTVDYAWTVRLALAVGAVVQLAAMMMRYRSTHRVWRRRAPRARLLTALQQWTAVGRPPR